MKKKKDTEAKKSNIAFSKDEEIASLREAGIVSAKKAIQESKALNLTITFLEGNTIYKEGPDGKKVKIAVID